MIEVYPSRDFVKAFKKIPVKIQLQSVQKDKLFRMDMYSPQLHTHRLKGKLSHYYSYRINRAYRILFELVERNKVIYHDIGTHSIYF